MVPEQNHLQLIYIGKKLEIFLFGFNALTIEDPEELRNKIIEKGLFSAADLAECASVGQLIDFVYKRKIRADIVEPTIIYNYPAVLKPLARRNDNDPTKTDVFQVVVAGTELCNAYSELVNPKEQRGTFEDQLKAKAQGDKRNLYINSKVRDSFEFT